MKISLLSCFALIRPLTKYLFPVLIFEFQKNKKKLERDERKLVNTLGKKDENLVPRENEFRKKD